MRIQVPVMQLEIDQDGDTMWIHSPSGATVLRIKSVKGFVIDESCENSVAHADVLIDGPLRIRVPADLTDNPAEDLMRRVINYLTYAIATLSPGNTDNFKHVNSGRASSSYTQLRKAKKEIQDLFGV